MKERFWEREGIYGGISWTMQDIMQIWYPAHGIHRNKGVMLGAYTFGERPARRLPPDATQSASSWRSGRARSPSRLPRLRRKRREHPVASHESHARLRGAMER